MKNKCRYKNISDAEKIALPVLPSALAFGCEAIARADARRTFRFSL